ncbi:unnamed protein product [Peniophora sp. CBMAI 1063]|nr:unnamed protein product [Peniophora sp. CBMAI 1063]
MWGSSTKNQRIERLWLDVGIQYARRWRAFFLRLERLHGLDRKNPHHIWLLHALFLDAVNQDCATFQEEWNRHPIRTESSQTPLQMRFASVVENGVYTSPSLDLHADVHPEILQRYHGVTRLRRGESTVTAADSDSGDSSDDDSSDEEDGPVIPEPAQAQDIADAAQGDVDALDIETLVEAFNGDAITGDVAEVARHIGSDQQANIRHDPIDVPDKRCPFASIEEETVFWEELSAREERGEIPGDMMVTQAEWLQRALEEELDEDDEDAVYPTMENIRVGRARKEYKIMLPLEIWFPRALKWARAVTLMNEILLVDN